MSKSTPTRPPQRRDRLIRETVHDTYKQSGQQKGMARCPHCGAFYVKGRWTWAAPSRSDVAERTCSACHRSADKYPAGELSLTGAFVAQHMDEIRNLARNIEKAENSEHPLNRIMEIRESAEQILITTTDVHLPRRIGSALEGAFEGELDIHFDKSGHFTRVGWRRD